MYDFSSDVCLPDIHAWCPVQISDKCDGAELIELIETINPNNTPGKIMIIVRMGADKLRENLPRLIKAVQDSGKIVVWQSDPMHGNTIKSDNGYKTRPFERIRDELRAFFDVHEQMGTHAGGVHLEMTGQDVTECTGAILEQVAGFFLYQLQVFAHHVRVLTESIFQATWKAQTWSFSPGNMIEFVESVRKRSRSATDSSDAFKGVNSLVHQFTHQNFSLDQGFCNSLFDQPVGVLSQVARRWLRSQTCLCAIIRIVTRG